MLIRDKVKIIATQYFRPLMAYPNVVGVGFGNKFIKGIDTEEPCIHILVSEKMPENSLNLLNRIPSFFMGIKIDVIPIGKLRFNSLTKKVRPLLSGYSIGPDKKHWGGSFSCFLKRKGLNGEETIFILSNNHILADFNKIPKGTKILQPSYDDGGRSKSSTVGILSEFVEFKFSTNKTIPINYVDCALVKVLDLSIVSKNRIAIINSIEGVEKAKVGETIRKVGMTTGLTSGKVKTINATITVDTPDEKDLLFHNQTLIDIHCDFGDSGALGINKNNKIVGLLSCSTKEGFTLFNDFFDVLKYTNTELYDFK